MDKTEWQDPRQVAQLKQYKSILTSWILPTNHTFTNATAIASEQAVQLKTLIGSNTPVFTYQSGILAPRFYPENLAIMMDGHHDDYFLRRSDGSFINSTTYCAQTKTDPSVNPNCAALLWNFCNDSAVEYYVARVLGAMVTDSHGKGLNFDGVFLDNSDEFSTRGAANAPCDPHNATMAVHIKTAQFFKSVGKWPIFSTTITGQACQDEANQIWAANVGYSKFWESFSPSLSAIEQLYNETEYGLPTFVHSTYHGWPFERKPPISLNSSLASFLVATGGAPHSYFQFSNGWYDQDWKWDPILGHEFGTATGPPSITKYGNMSNPGQIWTRAFSSGAHVKVNCTPPSKSFAWCDGDITLP